MWFSFAWIDVILIYMLGLRLHCYNSGVSRRKLRSQGFHIVLTKRKKREIFTSKLLVYYVVLQVYKHIGISPPAPDASLISERMYTIFVLKRYKNGLNISKTIYVLSNSKVFTFSIRLEIQKSIWIPLFLVIIPQLHKLGVCGVVHHVDRYVHSSHLVGTPLIE